MEHLSQCSKSIALIRQKCGKAFCHICYLPTGRCLKPPLVRGPLRILRDMWTDEDPQDTDDVVQYILQMRVRLSSMTELAQLNKQETQAYQKAWYDQSARDRVYQVGDKVLVVMPTSTHKLQAQWQGPYTISRRVGDLDYELICGRRKHAM